MKPFIVILGTRPEVIKLAPLIRELRDRGEPVQVVHTGQHTDMAESILEFFGIKVDVRLNVLERSKSLLDTHRLVLEGLDQKAAPDARGVFVQGDTASCAAGALWGFLRKIPVYHVEAGLRTYDLHSPWPEEYNRRSTALATTAHFCPTEGSAENLRAERYAESSIHVVGNTVIDALKWTAARIENDSKLRTEFAERFGLSEGRRLVLATVHRRESFGAPIRRIFQALRSLAEMDGVDVLIPLHRNPMVREAADEILKGSKVRIVEPLDYPDFVYLMSRSSLILSDSGGVQEEAPSLRRRVLILRESSERPEALEPGECELVGSETEAILAKSRAFLAKTSERPLGTKFGDGKSAKAIVDVVLGGVRA